jgi:hypothetical protein
MGFLDAATFRAQLGAGHQKKLLRKLKRAASVNQLQQAWWANMVKLSTFMMERHRIQAMQIRRPNKSHRRAFEAEIAAVRPTRRPSIFFPQLKLGTQFSFLLWQLVAGGRVAAVCVCMYVCDLAVVLRCLCSNTGGMADCSIQD